MNQRPEGTTRYRYPEHSVKYMDRQHDGVASSVFRIASALRCIHVWEWDGKINSFSKLNYKNISWNSQLNCLDLLQRKAAAMAA